MGQAIGGLLPSAVGVALSPVPIIAVILMLGTPKAKSNGPAFMIGWILGLAIVSVVVVLAASGSGLGADPRLRRTGCSPTHRATSRRTARSSIARARPNVGRSG